MDKRILIVEGSVASDIWRYVLERRNYQVKVFQNPQEARQRICRGLECDLAVVDLNFKEGFYGSVVIKQLEERYPRLPIISVSKRKDEYKESYVHLCKPLWGKRLANIIDEYFRSRK